MTKEKSKKKKVGKIILKVLLSILAIMIIASAVIGVLNVISINASMDLAKSFQPVQNDEIILPKQDENGNYYYEADRDLKVLQLTDIHFGGGCFSTRKDIMALNAVASMVTAEKPDLVVITGDLTFAIPFFSGTLNNLKPAKVVATLMEQLGVPWIPVFGNHDSEAYTLYTREEIADFYESDELEHCLFKKGPSDIYGFGNSVITVRNSDDIITQALFLFDSNAYLSDDKLGLLWKYDNIHQDQIDWYHDNAQALNLQNKERIATVFADDKEGYNDAMEKYGDVTQLLFFHIPLMEYKDAWNAHINGDDSINVHYGTVGETGGAICTPMSDDNLFETMQEIGGKKGIFCGHDHLNNFSLDYQDVRLTFGYSIDYLAYSGISKIGSQRGCTIITLANDGTFDCMGSNYYQDKYIMQNDSVKESVTMQDMAENGKPTTEKN